MKLVKSLLLGASAGLLAVAGANAADLPSRKAAPVTYVKVCDAYGAGFFYIPGTDTCLKVGGYVRAEYQITPRANVSTDFRGINLGVGVVPNTVIPAGAQDAFGIRARGRVDLDARTQTAWGTVRTVMGLRLQTQSGQYANAQGYQNPAVDASKYLTGPALEAAFIQFAGFTAGRAGENFAFMPPFTWTGQHFWAGYPVGIKQLAYTATFGGGFSATIALEDHALGDFNYLNAAGNSATGLGTFSGAAGAPNLVFPNDMPVITGNVRVDQAWGSAQIMASVGQNRAYGQFGPALLPAATYKKTGYAIGAGVKFNLPMLAAGDSLWLTAAYADGFIDQLQGANTSTNSPDSSQNSRGLLRTDYNMWVNPTTGAAENEKGYSLGALLVHYWAPTWRSVFAASYINLTPPTSAQIGLGTAAAPAGLSKMHGYNLSGSLIWSPIANFDIGAEIQYRKIDQSVSAAQAANLAAQGVSVSPGTWDARLRVQRTF